MKKHLILALSVLAIVGSSCSDDEIEGQILLGSEQAVLDGKTYLISGFGNGVDITQTIGNSKAQILDLELLKNAGGIEVNTTQEKVKIIRSAKNYSEMNKQINSCLANGAALDFVRMPFAWNLNDLLKASSIN